MFDFSWAEIILIGIVGMVLIGPQDLPKVLRWVSDMIKKARKMASEFHSQFDEVIKDPDLKEAKDQFMQLRNLNVKSAILNAIDKDGSLQETFKNPPLSTSTALSDFPSVPLHDKGHHDIEPIPAWHSDKEDNYHESTIDLKALEVKDPAPIFFPPPIAQRMQIKRSAPPSPSMIPPQIAKYKEQRWS